MDEYKIKNGVIYPLGDDKPLSGDAAMDVLAECLDNTDLFLMSDSILPKVISEVNNDIVDAGSVFGESFSDNSPASNSLINVNLARLIKPVSNLGETILSIKSKGYTESSIKIEIASIIDEFVKPINLCFNSSSVRNYNAEKELLEYLKEKYNTSDNNVSNTFVLDLREIVRSNMNALLENIDASFKIKLNKIHDILPDEINNHSSDLYETMIKFGEELYDKCRNLPLIKETKISTEVIIMMALFEMLNTPYKFNYLSNTFTFMARYPKLITKFVIEVTDKTLVKCLLTGKIEKTDVSQISSEMVYSDSLVKVVMSDGSTEKFVHSNVYSSSSLCVGTDKHVPPVIISNGILYVETIMSKFFNSLFNRDLCSPLLTATLYAFRPRRDFNMSSAHAINDTLSFVFNSSSAMQHLN